MDNPANCPENSSCPVGCPQGLGQPPHRSALQPLRGLPTFPQALRLITRSREPTQANNTARPFDRSVYRYCASGTAGRSPSTGRPSSCLRAPRRARTISASATAAAQSRGSAATGSRHRRQHEARGVFELPAGAHSRTCIQSSSPSFTRRATVTSTPRLWAPARVASPGGAAARAVMNGRRRSPTVRSGEAAVPPAG